MKSLKIVKHVMLIGVNICVFGSVLQCHAWFNLDRYVAKAIMSTLKFSVRCGVQVVINNPQTVAILLALYFYKEIIRIGADITSFIAGEFPYVAAAVGLVGLYYVMKYCDGFNTIKKKVLSAVDQL